MKTMRLIGILVCLTFGIHSLAERVCPDGVEQHMMYGFYCAETSPEAYQLASIQLTILRIQNPGDSIYYKTLSYFEFNGEICIYVEFVRCIKNPKEFSPQGNKNASEINYALAGLEKLGYDITDVRTYKDGTAEASITSPEGEFFSITFDWTGRIANVSPEQE